MVEQKNIDDKTKIYTVSEITAQIKKLLKDSFPAIYVKGEISNYKIASSGHIYFSLKDEKAVINCALFKYARGKVKFQPEDGLKVVALGDIGLYEPSGSYNLIIKELIPEGKGALQLAFEQLKAKLEKEGLFKEVHKKSLPGYPESIGVITSLQGAVLRDILRVLNRRYPDINILIFPAVVQGEASAGTLVKGIKVFNKFFPVDLIILGRGGGSIEDLWSFNEEAVARAIYASKIPVISAVGHEVDWTISDLVADVRAPTPSAAAEIAVKNREEIYKKIDDHGSRIISLLEDRINRESMKYDNIYLKYSNISKDILKAKIDSLNTIFQEFIQTSGIRMMNEENRFKTLANKLALLNPFIILERGYSITYKMPEGEILKDSSRVKSDDDIRVKLHKGEITAKVTKKPGKPGDGP